METNNFKMNTKRSSKKEFLSKIRGIFGFTLLLTGICSVVGIIFIIGGVTNRFWDDVGGAVFVNQLLFYISMICIFISLLKIAVDEKPFSGTLTFCLRVLSFMYLLGAVLLPRLAGFVSSGFDILAVKGNPLIEGRTLVFGLLLFVLSVLVKEGFDMQKELDEVL